MVLGLDVVDIYLDSSYPGYSDGLLALKNVSISSDPFAISNYDIYVNINFLSNRKVVSSFSSFQDISKVYVVDYTDYKSSQNYYIHNSHYEFLGDVPDDLILNSLRIFLENCNSLLENLEEHKIKLYTVNLEYLSVNIDESCDISHIVKLVYDVCVQVHSFSKYKRLEVAFYLSKEDAEGLYDSVVKELYSVYETSCSSVEQESLTDLYITCLFRVPVDSGGDTDISNRNPRPGLKSIISCMGDAARLYEICKNHYIPVRL
jgi:hypothetical protein